VLLSSDKVDHAVVKIAIALTIGLLFIKIYMETIKGQLMGVECTYDNNKNETHASIALISISGCAFQWALWPQYGWYTPIIMAAVSYGVVLQVICLIPWPIVQNLTAVVSLTYFLQTYAGV